MGNTCHSKVITALPRREGRDKIQITWMVENVERRSIFRGIVVLFLNLVSSTSCLLISAAGISQRVMAIHYSNSVSCTHPHVHTHTHAHTRAHTRHLQTASLAQTMRPHPQTLAYSSTTFWHPRRMVGGVIGGWAHCNRVKVPCIPLQPLQWKELERGIPSHLYNWMHSTEMCLPHLIQPDIHVINETVLLSLLPPVNWPSGWHTSMYVDLVYRPYFHLVHCCHELIMCLKFILM
jgi:hypothetical protein